MQAQNYQRMVRVFFSRILTRGSLWTLSGLLEDMTETVEQPVEEGASWLQRGGTCLIPPVVPAPEAVSVLCWPVCSPSSKPAVEYTGLADTSCSRRVVKPKWGRNDRIYYGRGSNHQTLHASIQTGKIWGPTQAQVTAFSGCVTRKYGLFTPSCLSYFCSPH